MLRISGDYIYTLAATLTPLGAVSETSTRFQIYAFLKEAIPVLDNLLSYNTPGLRSSWHKGNELLAVAREVFELIEQDPASAGQSLEARELRSLSKALLNFEIPLKAELAVANLYLLTTKGAYDTGTLAEFGVNAFPETLAQKVPDSVYDAQQGGRCIAFDLPTASAFHMHRAHEAVVHAYFRALAPAEKPPERQAIGTWLVALEKAGATKDIRATLRDINNLHRNPVLHPEQTLKDSSEAIALLGSVYTSMRYMLPTIPDTPP